LIVPLLIILALAGALAYLMLKPGATDVFRTTTAIEDPATIDATVIGFAGATYADDFGYLRLPGYVDNISDSDVRSVSIQIQLSDADGNKMELIEHTAKDIPAKTRQTFDINAGVLPPDRVATIAIVKIEVYSR